MPKTPLVNYDIHEVVKRAELATREACIRGFRDTGYLPLD